MFCYYGLERIFQMFEDKNTSFYTVTKFRIFKMWVCPRRIRYFRRKVMGASRSCRSQRLAYTSQMDEVATGVRE
jgi:hypothetical protein